MRILNSGEKEKQGFNGNYAIVEEIKKEVTVENGKSVKFSFNSKLDLEYNYRLHIIGEVGLPYMRRYEGVLPIFYRKLDNSIKSIEQGRVLVFDKNNQVKERTCYTMLKGCFSVGKKYRLIVKAKILGAKDNFTLSAETYYGKHNSRYYYEKSDITTVIRLTDSKDYTTFSAEFTAKQEIDFIMIKLSATDFDGYAEVFVPELIDESGVNICYPYDDCPENLEDFKWIGEGFSLIERPEVTLIVNGKEVFSGRKMDALQRFSGLDFQLPSEVLKTENNIIEVKYGNNIKPYTVIGARLITEPKTFELLGVKQTVRLGEEFGVFCYNKNGKTPEIEISNYVEYVKTVQVGEWAVIKLKAKKTGKDIIVKAINDEQEKSIKIPDIVEKENEFIITGTGDFIYVTAEMWEFSEYLSWYLNNGVGNLLTFRCVYHWGRVNELDERFWRTASKLLSALGIYYSVMIDGRELNGLNANPDKEIVDTPYYLGMQTHERDGAFMYWDQNLNEMHELYYHLLSRKMKYNGIYGKRSPVYDKTGKAWLYYTQDSANNVKEAYENFRNNLAYTAIDGATRHTGVTTKFHTFLEAGYDWVGYESMYGTHELFLGVLRGTANACGKKKTGTHLALQWSSVPTDDPKHFIRYRLSLYLSYMHGVSEINTEEGLWRIENPFADFDRYSYACVGHREEQSKFNKFINTHTRRGKQRVDIAMVMGKYDGMEGFSCPNVFGQEGWAYGAPEKSWDAVKTFYPDSDINAIYYYIREGGEKNMPQKDKDLLEVRKGLYRDVIDYKPVGFYTNTPYGVIDVIPESVDNYSDYKFLFFTGWNTADEEQIKKLCKFVENGGTLLLAKPHLYTTVDREVALKGKSEILNSVWVDKLLSYKKDGRVIYFDRDEYPIAYLDEYTAVIKEYAQKYQSKHIFDTKYLSYTEYVREDGAIDYYLININWWNEECAKFRFNLNGQIFNEKIQDNELKILTVKDDVAILVNALDAEVEKIENAKVSIKVINDCEITIFRNGKKEIRNGFCAKRVYLP